jgi:hypothetical protein
MADVHDTRVRIRGTAASFCSADLCGRKRATHVSPHSQPSPPVRNHEDYLRIPHERIRNFAIIAHGA